MKANPSSLLSLFVTAARLLARFAELTEATKSSRIIARQGVCAGLTCVALTLGFRAKGQPVWINLSPLDNGSVPAMALDGGSNTLVTMLYTNSYSTIKLSSAGVLLWAVSFAGASDDPYAYPRAIAVDGSGNVFVTGGACDQNNKMTYATVKYSSAGMPLWTNWFSGLATNAPGGIAYAIAVKGGDVFVAGITVDENTNSSYATIKYSNAGAPLWTNVYSGRGSTSLSPPAIAVDGSGNVAVTGSIQNTQATGAYYAYQWVTIKYSNAGVPLWANFYAGDNGFATASVIAVDGGDNVFVTGEVYADQSYTNLLYATIKYSSAGAPLWTNNYGPARDKGFSQPIVPNTCYMAVDNSSNVILFVTSGGAVLTYYPLPTFCSTIKYSSAGVPLWTNLFNGLASNAATSIAAGIAVDGRGNVFVTGQSADDNFYSDYFTIEYSSAGLPLWTNVYSVGGAHNANAFPSAIAVDGSGNALVTGISYDGTGWACATIKYRGAAAPPVAYLYAQWLNKQLVLSWTDASFSLQSAPQVTATFTNIPGAVSPYTNAASSAQQFFRLKQ